MIKNQYLIHSRDKIFNSTFLQKKFINITIEHDFRLDYFDYHFENRSIALLGYLVDPLKPKNDENQILSELASTSTSIDNFFLNLQRFSGRFIILFSLNGHVILSSDTFGLRQIYFIQLNNELFISSSPELLIKSLDIQPNLKPHIMKLIADKDYRANESPWLGNKWYDESFEKVLPNHFLEILSGKISRIPFFITKMTELETLQYTKEMLTGSITAIKNRFNNIIMPLTAGWDSRLVLASSLHIKDLVEYYLFINHSNELNNPDAVIGIRLSSKLDLNYQLIHPSSLKCKFIDEYNQANLFPRILPKTRHIQWHYYNNSTRNVININGSGGEILRRVYQYFEKNKQADVETLIKTRIYNDHFKQEIEDWHYKTKDFARAYNLDILDLFYWEQRLGNWHALFDYEQEIAIEEFTPFNNRNLLLAVLQLPKILRKKYNSWIFIELMKIIEPKLLTEPFNPIMGFKPKKRALVFLRKHPSVLSFLKRII